MKLGIDLGGTKIEIIALDNQGVELLRRRVQTPQGDYSATLHAIENLVHAAEAELGQRGSAQDLRVRLEFFSGRPIYDQHSVQCVC